ncbi:MAG: hypothetical protein IPO40_18425 [Fibrobacteres bacterium]|nr:hypothetical protein [Fibrobacterota bacterium]
MSRKLFWLLCVAVFGLVGCLRAEGLQVSAEKHPAWEEIATKGYVLKHPKGLLVDRSGLMGTELVIFLKNPPVPNQFGANLNLLIQDLGGQQVSLDQYAEISLDQVNRLISNSVVIENSRKKGVKGEYQRMMYTGDQGVYHLQFEQFYALAHGKAFILTLTCEQTNFEQCRGVGEGIMNTFVLK